MRIALNREALSSVVSMAVLIGGCPKRQTAPSVIYVPSPPSAASPAPAPDTETVQIEEPPPPQPQEEASPAEPAPPRPVRRRPHIPRTEPSATEPAAPPPETEPPPAEVPPLAPHENPAQGVALRQQLLGLKQNVEGRIARLTRSRLSAADQKSLDDARGFLAQSEQALEDGDLERALTLARKSDLVISALEH